MNKRAHWCLVALLPWLLAAEARSKNATIRARAGESEIVITATHRVAGAIHSLTWNGKEFVDSYDHGRQIQSAASFDCGNSKSFWPECFNPTEAGSRADGSGDASSSKLLSLTANGAELRTKNQMAFWLAPGEKSYERGALNDKALSNHVLSKRVQIGYKDRPHVVSFEITFTVPPGERHMRAQFEALTGYMPPEFERFWKFVPASGKLEKLDDGPGEQQFPIVFSNAAETHALGVYSPDQPARGYEHAGYGRFRYLEEKVVKWNCVFREGSTAGIATGERRFRVFVAVGSLEIVGESLAALTREFAKR